MNLNYNVNKVMYIMLGVNKRVNISHLYQCALAVNIFILTSLLFLSTKSIAPCLYALKATIRNTFRQVIVSLFALKLN